MKQTARHFAKPIAPGALLAAALLWLAVIASALAVVASTHQVRKQTNTLETLRREAAQLQVEWGQYLLEQSTWASYSRVEAIATQQLGMFPATAERIVMVNNHE